MDHFFMAAEQLSDQLALSKVSRDIVCTFRIFRERIRSPVQNRDFSAGGQQFENQMCADKPGSAYYKSIQFILTRLTFLVEYPPGPARHRVSGMTKQPPGHFKQ